MCRALLMPLPLTICCSCAAPVLQVTALNPGSTWNRGVMETTLQSDSLEWHVAFVGMEQDHLVFAVAAHRACRCRSTGRIRCLAPRTRTGAWSKGTCSARSCCVMQE